MSNFLITPLDFITLKDRPFFFTSYVSTIDGKIYVKKPGYWPIGSRNDYDYFTFLRAHADVIVEGKNTALAFGDKTINTIHSDKFLSFRKMLGKDKPVEYIVLSRNLDKRLAEVLQNKYQFKTTIITSSDMGDESSFSNDVTIEKMNSKRNETIIPSLVNYLTLKKYINVFLDVGPVLLADFIKSSALDELFLTISPKLFGSSNETVALGDNELFSLKEIPVFSLISSERLDDEMFLRYRRK